MNKNKKIVHSLIVGFVVLAVAVTGIVTYHFFNLHATKHKYELAAHKHFVKLNLVIQMRDAAHERTLALQKMLLQTDPFIRDEEWIRFNQLGANFARSRLSILSMQLTDTEKKQLNYQGNFTKNALDSQKRVVELLEKDQFVAARDVLLRKVIPSKEQVINQLNTFYNFQYKEAEHLSQKAEDIYHEFYSLAWLLVSALSISGIAIVTYIVRRSRTIETKLTAANLVTLKQSEEKSQFLIELVDEFRHPLHSLAKHSGALIENCQKQPAGNKEILSQLDCIKSACQHLESLTSDIREITKAESGQFALTSSEVDIYEFVHDIARQIKPIAAKNSNQIDVQCPVHIGRIDTDPTKLRQILFNLLANACKYTEFGLITLSVKPSTRNSSVYLSRHWVSFSVIDTGIGISQDKIDKIFSKGHDIHKLRNKSPNNSGINLSISRRMAHILGGEISVNSEPGMGSIFSIKLPYETSPPLTTTLQ